MSYDLYFWRQTSECELDPLALLDQLDAGTPVPGVEPFPVDAFRRRMKEEFPELEENVTSNPQWPLQLIWDEPEGDGSFIISLPPRPYYISVNAHGVDGLDLNRIVDIAFGLGAPLYDPQTNVRYTEWSD